MDKLRSLLVLLVSGVLAGCLPIAPAHKTVQVPPLEVRLHGLPPDEMAALEILRARVPYEAFVEILRSDGRFGRLGASSLEFEAESRYTAVPAISFLPEDPNYGKEHTLFLRVRSADDDVYRIAIDGRKAVVKKTSLSQARQALPPAFEDPQGPVYREIPKLDFYDTVRWSDADRVAVERFSRGEQRDVLILQIR